MKSLLDVVKGNGVVTSEDIAQQIVGLDKRIPEYRAAVDQAESAAQELHKLNVCGGAVSSSDLEKAARKVELARRDLSGAEATLQDLDKLLTKALFKEKEKEISHLQERQKILYEDRNKLLDEYKDAYIKAKVVQAMLGGVEESIHCALAINASVAEVSAKIREAIGPEIKKTSYYLIRGCESELTAAKNRDLEAEKATLLNKMRNG